MSDDADDNFVDDSDYDNDEDDDDDDDDDDDNDDDDKGLTASLRSRSNFLNFGLLLSFRSSVKFILGALMLPAYSFVFLHLPFIFLVPFGQSQE